MPVALLAAIALAPTANATTLTFGRGLPAPSTLDGIDRYWGAEDTVLESRTPQRNAGGAVELQGGNGKTILIRFGDLARFTGSAKVLKARIEFTVADGTRPSLTGVNRVLVPWGEGPANTLMNTLSGNATAAAGSATWQHRRAGTGNDAISWQQGGALGTADAEPISGATLAQEGERLILAGLESVVQTWLDRPYDNHGLSLRFAADTTLWSSQAPGDRARRPRLILEVEPKAAASGADLAVLAIQPGAQGTWSAVVVNQGTAPATAKARWITNERAGGQFDLGKTLAPGETVTFESSRKTGGNGSLGFRLDLEDANPANNALTVQEGAVAIPSKTSEALAAQSRVELWNQVILPQSRFSFAPDGATARLRVELKEDATTPDHAMIARALGLTFSFGKASVVNVPQGERIPSISPWHPGFLFQDGDTRFEGAVPGLMALLYDPIYHPLTSNLDLESTGLLTATQVAQINGKFAPGEVLGEIPGSIILKAIDRTSQPLASVELALFQSKSGQFDLSAPTATVTTGPNGTVLIPSQPGGALPSGKTVKANPFGVPATDGGNGTFLIRATSHGVTEWGYLSIWQLVDAASRGSKAATIHEMVFNLPNLPLENTNLARSRFVSDSEDRLPAQAVAAVDEDVKTGFALGDKAGNWIEIDLGRDRPVGEIQLTFGNAFPSRYELVLYGTGQQPDRMNPWNREVDAPFAVKSERTIKGDGTQTFTYRGTAVRVRYVRLRNVSGGAGDLREVRVLATRTPGG